MEAVQHKAQKLLAVVLAAHPAERLNDMHAGAAGRHHRGGGGDGVARVARSRRTADSQKRTADRQTTRYLRGLPTAPLCAHLYPLNCGATLSTSRLITIGDTHENGGCDRIPSMSNPNAVTESIHYIIMTWNITPCNTMHPCNRRHATSSHPRRCDG
jgi:hypothetical protein